MNTFRDLRGKKQITQADIAKTVGVDQTAVSQWERGVTYPATAKLSLIANLLGCSEGELIAAITAAKENTAPRGAAG